MRLTIKAGKSSATQADLPSRSTSFCVASKVASDVAMPRIISTNSITGTGFMKCMPINCSGRSVAAAKRVMDSDEVLEAIIACGGSTELTSRRMSILMASFSLAASMATPTSPIIDRLSAGCILASAASLSASLILPPATCRARLPVMVAMPASMRSWLISLSRTRAPDRANT